MKELAKLPELPVAKFNKRVGKFTPVIRVYRTKRGGFMFFQDVNGTYKYCSTPFMFWTPCAYGFPKMQEFYARICGVN